MKRRDFLKSLGGAAIAGPALSILPSKSHAMCPDGPKRIITLTYPMGIATSQWKPRGTATEFTLPYCTAPLEAFKERCLFVSNVDNAVLRLRDEFVWGHPQKKESALTGTLVASAFGGAGRNHVDDIIVPNDQNGGAKSASIEAVVGRSIAGNFPMRSVNLGVRGRSINRDRMDSLFHWEAEATPASMILNPGSAFQTYFEPFVAAMNPTGPSPAVVAEQRRRASILDAVRAQFQSLRAGLDYRDRRRLDFHAEYIRQIEVDLPVSDLCQRPADIPRDRQWHREASMREHAAIQVRMLAQAMACNIAPVGRLEFLVQQNPFFGIPSIDDAVATGRQALGEANWGWHAICHTNQNENDPVTGRPTRPSLDTPMEHPESAYSRHLLDGLRFYVQVFADLLQELDRFDEGPDGRSVLDNSLCVLATDLGDGQGHAPNRMGYILAGNLGPFRTGYHFDGAPTQRWYSESPYNHTNVLTTIANAFCLQNPDGSELTHFGIEGFGQTGALPVRRT